MERAPVPTGPLADAVANLSDRALRKLLGARAYLRGVDYVRRGAVSEISIDPASATGRVRGSADAPYEVHLALSPDGVSSQCNCPLFSKIDGHCKHVAALLIAVREQVRGGRPRPSQPQGQMSNPNQVTAADIGRHDARGVRRGRRGHGTVSHLAALAQAATRVPTGTGLDAWLPEGIPESGFPDLEFRITIRGSTLNVVVIDPSVRAPVSPAEALAIQALAPTGDREALRVLARHERGDPRRGLELRGEDASELIAKLEGRRVLLEPSLMHLRWNDDRLRPRFDLELSRRGAEASDTVVVKASFERKGDGRRFSLQSGAWFDGAPGWHVDTMEGIARPLDRRVTPAWLQRLWRTPQIQYPLEQLPFLLSEAIPKIASEIGAELPSLSEVADEIDLPPAFKLRAFGELIEARVQLSAVYGETELEVRADGMSPPIVVLPPTSPGKKARCVRANVLAQQEAVERVRELGFVPDEDGKGLLCRGDDAIHFWTEGLGSLPEDWEYFVPDDLVDVQVRSDDVGARARVSTGMDWLGLKITFAAGGIAVPPDELARCLSEGRKYVRLEDGSFANFDAAKVREVLARQAEILANAKNGKIPLSQAGRVQELLNHVANAQVGADARELFQKLASVDEIEAVKKPRNLKATLRPYQESGLAWLAFLHDLGTGGVLADDMGLGKTLETIALLLHLKNDRKKREEAGEKVERHLTLIVAPTSVVPNWIREIEKFAPSLKAVAWHGAERHELAEELEDYDIVITSYALLRRDEEQLGKLKLAYAILDEAQQIKNPMSATARAAKRLNAHRRLALTGTPIENRLSEIWSIFDFVSPGLLGDLAKFEQRYATPIDRGDSKAAARLRAAIHPFVLRRTKEEVAKDLPEKIEIEQPVELAAEQQKLYAQVLQEVRASVLGEIDKVGIAKAQIQILAALTRLRQVACDPRLLGLPRAFTDDDSGKLDALRELVQEAYSGGHRMLIFSQFTSMLALIKKAMEEDGIKYEYLDGSTKDRQDRVDRFNNDPTMTIFLISLKAGGMGLNLTGADTVVHFDPWWNPAVEDQATDRAHRIGQTRVVTVYKLVAKGTIEEKILQLAAKKRALVDAVLTEDAGGAKKLTRQDIDDLFASD
ncbi:MAG: SNF2 helicase associated domain-containing protein [Deltaproteobacteria bacterium]|nr:SNF2 helicase associated domain-containing protein [Deltaproteobacteria bacterium]